MGSQKIVCEVNPCVTCDTIILTSQGLKTVKELEGRQFTAIVDAKPYPSTDTGFWKTGDSKVFLITLENGIQIKATYKHQFLSLQGWLQVEEIQSILNSSLDVRLVLSQNHGFRWYESSYEQMVFYILDRYKREGSVDNEGSLLLEAAEPPLQLQQQLLAVGIESFVHGCTLFIKKDTFNRIMGVSQDHDDSTMTFTSRVVSVQELEGTYEVYDCTIPDMHCYSANGIVSHNCVEKTHHNKV